jgi:hypothetical protein
LRLALGVLAAATVLVPAVPALAQQDGYYMTMFASEAAPNVARSSHTFATFVHVEAGAVAEELTVSWLPAPGHFGPDYTMPRFDRVPGHNYTLDETVAMGAGRMVTYWGPMAITQSLYERAAARVAFLERAETSYKMFVLSDTLRGPALENQPGGAINCIMGVSDIGGYLNTGTSYGIGASQKVLEFLLPQVLDPRSDAGVSELMRLRERLTGAGR